MGCVNEKAKAAEGAAAPAPAPMPAAAAAAAGAASASASKTAAAMSGGAAAQQGASGTGGLAAAGASTAAAPMLNVLNAAKMDLKDLTEKEPFHTRYTLGDVLGRGNYSVVRKGAKIGDTTGTPYAVKCIKESSLTHEDREALKIETAILKGMDCPHIIKLFGFYEEKKEKMFYIVTEFVGGGELFDRIIAKEYYSEVDAQKLVRTVAIAIKYCHDRNVVHRDLKPENILLTSKNDDESIKIADFGFAKQYDTSSDDALSTSCGTPGYVAPEILNGKKYHKEVDMWSFGVIIFILLCGYPPFHHENQKELFKQIRTGAFSFDPEYWSAVSPQAKDLIQKLLVVDPAMRLTIDQLLEHEWLRTEANATALPKVTANITDILAKRRLKAGVQAVIAQNRMKKLLDGVKDAASEIQQEAAQAQAQAQAATAAPKMAGSPPKAAPGAMHNALASQ
jgi:serine/threonine protein kinase